MAKCNCGKRVISDVCKEMPENCFDVCRNPICGTPGVISIMAPVVYDEVGINLCTTWNIASATLATAYPTAVSACVVLRDMVYTYGPTDVNITQIAGRSKCFQVSLSNLTANFAISLYDANCTLIDTIYETASYLPGLTTAPSYDEDTNPTNVKLEIFAPYGVAFGSDTTPPAPVYIMHHMGMNESNSNIAQGLNMYGIPKVINLDVASNTISVGLTLVVQSVYFAGYRLKTKGRIHTPKANLDGNGNGNCLDFVEGKLLDLAIKPLYLGAPLYEEELKNDCEAGSCCGCQENDYEDKEERDCDCDDED